MLIARVCALACGFCLDCLLGDPHWMPHPVRAIGWFVQKTESFYRRIFPKSNRGEFWAGAAMTGTVIAVCWGVSASLVFLAWNIYPLAAFLLETVLCYQLLAARSLAAESKKVYAALMEGDLPKARRAVSMIVGRDTQNLSAEQVTKAAVETVAENTSDGVTAPMIFFALGGAPLAFLYKAVNTMDSMVGYKNEHYFYFGRAAAKLDDILNYLPARITAWFMILAAYLVRFDGKKAIQIYKRDRFNHSSPNSAQSESVCAGALNLQLAGDAYYFGKLVEKPTIGDAARPAMPCDICRSILLMQVTVIITLCSCLGAMGLIHWLAA